MTKSLWVDLETTGIDFRDDRITEIAAIYYPDGDEFHEYIRHEKYPDNYAEVAKMTGLTPELLAEKGSTEKMVYTLLIYFLDKHIDKFNKLDKLTLCGFCVGFDDNFLRALFQRYGNNYYSSYIQGPKCDVQSFWAMARMIEAVPAAKKNSLEGIAEAFGLKYQAHSAIDDIKTTKKLFEILIEKFVAKAKEGEGNE